MNESSDSVYPDFLRSGLGKLNLLDSRSELLALFAALEHFRRDLHSQNSVPGILNMSCRYVAGLNLFRTMSFWLVNPADLSFELSLAEPAESRAALQEVVDRQIKAGRFAVALRESSPAFFLLDCTETSERGVLHSLALSSQVVGMFCGLLKGEVAPAQDVAFSLLSMLLGASADALATLRKTRQLTSQIEILHSLLPLCAWCKKVRNDSGYWEQIEKYITANSAAQITHSICPDCRQKFFQDVSDQ